jgi:hypothetical protein
MTSDHGDTGGRLARGRAAARDSWRRLAAAVNDATTRANLAIAARPWLEPAVLGTAIVLGVLYLIAIAEGRVFFHNDECTYLDVYLQRPPIEWLRPHNEHWTTLSIAAWAVLVNVFGTGSYIPFKVLLLAGHAAAVVALWALIRPYQPRLALLAAILFLFLGAGHENLLYAIQIQVTAVMALGLWALWAALRDRMALATVLLTVGLAFQTTELLFLPAVAVVLAARGRWRTILWLLVPIAVFLAWYLTWGQEGVWRPLVESGTFQRVVPWLYTSLADALFDTFGIRVTEGLSTLIAVGAMVVAIALARGWRPPPITLGAITGLLAGYTLIGLGRAPGLASSRYVYIASAMYLLALTGLPRVRGVWVTVALVVFVFALRYNYFELQSGLVAFEGYSHDPALACRL